MPSIRVPGMFRTQRKPHAAANDAVQGGRSSLSWFCLPLLDSSADRMMILENNSMLQRWCRHITLPLLCLSGACSWRLDHRRLSLDQPSSPPRPYKPKYMVFISSLGMLLSHLLSPAPKFAWPAKCQSGPGLPNANQCLAQMPISALRKALTSCQ